MENNTTTNTTTTTPINLDYDKSLGDWIIDTDPGIDDAFALTLAMNLLKDNLKLISVQCGNVGIQQCLINAQKLCVINERKYNTCYGGSHTISCKSLKSTISIHGKDGFFDIPKYSGYEKYYDTKRDYINQEQVDRENITLLKSHSAIEIVKLSRKYGYNSNSNNNNNKLNIMTIGPLTNLAIAYMLDPTLPSRINKLVIMGGSYDSYGNIASNGEFNFACDDVAVKKVLDVFKNIVVYCWEPSVNHLVFPEHIVFDKKSKNKEKALFVAHVVAEKMSSLQAGVYADYGAAVVGLFPQSVVGWVDGFVDVVVDTESAFLGKFVVSEENLSCNKDKVKHRVVERVDMRYFHGLFNKMINE